MYALVVNNIILQSDIKQQQNKINKTGSYKGQLIAVVKLSQLCFHEYIYVFSFIKLQIISTIHDTEGRKYGCLPGYMVSLTK